MDSSAWTAIATGLLVLVGVVQVGVVAAQRQQHRLELADRFRQRWQAIESDWATVIFLGRNPGEYYQIAGPAHVRSLETLTRRATLTEPTTWALSAVRRTTGLLSDAGVAVLEGTLNVADVYAIFGTEMLRQGRPIRCLLESSYEGDLPADVGHARVRRELQDWLVYHDGVRRRCLILMDLLWAEAVRRLDLPPDDVIRAAEAKAASGPMCRRRLIAEARRLSGLRGSWRAWKLADLLRRAEFRKHWWQLGLDRKALEQLDTRWTDRLLRNR